MSQKTIPQVPPSVIRSVAAGMIAWLRSKGAKPELTRKPSGLLKRIPLTPGHRSSMLFLSLSLMILPLLPLSAENFQVLSRNLSFRMHGMARPSWQDRPILIDPGAHRRYTANENMGLVFIGAPALLATMAGASVEPRFLVTKKILVDEMKNYNPYHQLHPKALSRIMGGMVAGISGGLAAATFNATGGGLSGALCGIMAGTATSGILGAVMHGSVKMGRHASLLGLISSSIAVGASLGAHKLSSN